MAEFICEINEGCPEDHKDEYSKKVCKDVDVSMCQPSCRMICWMEYFELRAGIADRTCARCDVSIAKDQNYCEGCLKIMIGKAEALARKS